MWAEAEEKLVKTSGGHRQNSNQEDYLQINTICHYYHALVGSLVVAQYGLFFSRSMIFFHTAFSQVFVKYVMSFIMLHRAGHHSYPQAFFLFRKVVHHAGRKS